MTYPWKNLSGLWLVVSIMVLSVCVPSVLYADKGAGASANAPMPAVEVSVIRVQERIIEPSIELSGRVSAFRIAQVRPQINGIISKRLFSEGSHVKAGQILYLIDPDMYQATLESAQAGLVRAQALEYAARLKAKRYKALAATKAVSIQEETDIQAVWKQSQAEVLAAKAAVKAAQINVHYTKIKAPISGRIGTSLMSEGALVTAQQPSPLSVIQQLDPVYVDVTQSANDLFQLKHQIMDNANGTTSGSTTRVQVVLADGSLHGSVGEVAFSGVTVDPSTGSVLLRAIVPNPNQELLPGMFVRAKLISSRKQGVLTVPQAALSRDSRGKASVMVVTSDFLVENRMVETGHAMGKDMVITRGLTKGEQVVVYGLQKIRPGMKVSISSTKDSSSSNPANRRGE